MQVTFLGTAAAEGIPALWCACEHCAAARRERGRSLRRRSALLIDGRLLIDFGPDIVDAVAQLGLDLSPVRTLLITHDHEDHLHLPSLAIRREGFCATPLRKYWSAISLPPSWLRLSIGGCGCGR